jgi:hypothetical protein
MDPIPTRKDQVFAGAEKRISPMGKRPVMLYHGGDDRALLLLRARVAWSGNERGPPG